MLNPSAVVFLTLFMLVSLYHLYVCLALKEQPRRITKPLLMPLLLGAYLSMGKASPLMILALIASLAGDVWLLDMREARIKPGIASFLICQLLYIAQWAVHTEWIHATALGLLVPTVFYIAVGVALYRYLGGGNGFAHMRPPVLAYLTVILCMSFMSLQYMLTTSGWPGRLIFAGSLVFMVSDTTLAFETFRAPFRHSNFVIMATYLAAQLLIILGAGWP
jgi:uncharacterized membrane protein YhhN